MNVESWFRSPNFVLDNFAVYCKIFEIAGRSCSTVSRIHSQTKKPPQKAKLLTLLLLRFNVSVRHSQFRTRTLSTFYATFITIINADKIANAFIKPFRRPTIYERLLHL